MIPQILDALRQTTFLHDCRVLERDETPNGTFVLKVRCRAKSNYALQVWLKSSPKGLRYAYQLLAGKETLLRWDNAPHFPDLDNFPHHFHKARGRQRASNLMGDALRDLSHVLSEVKEYLET